MYRKIRWKSLQTWQWDYAGWRIRELSNCYLPCIEDSSITKALPFCVENYSDQQLESAWHEIRRSFSDDKYIIRAALWNTGQGIWKPFLDITPEEVRESLQINIEAAFSFSRSAIKTFKDNDIDPSNGARGTLLFTGATASLRGNVTTSAFAAGKFGSRALSQSLAKEFGKQNIHVAHVSFFAGCLFYQSWQMILVLFFFSFSRQSSMEVRPSLCYAVNQFLLIDILGILTDRSRQRRPDWDSDDKQAERLSPESIAQVSLLF